jgi:transposase InsO family protein
MTLEDSVVLSRLRVIQRARELGNVSEACRQFGISRSLFYRWKKRYVLYGEEGLWPRPGRGQRWPRQSPPELEHAVLAYALAWPTHGPARIAWQLRHPRWGGWKISPSGVYGILRRHGLQTRWERLARTEMESLSSSGLVTERTRRKLQRAQGKTERHVHARKPGDLVCLDTFFIGKLKGVGSIWQITACDAASSFAVAMLSTEHTAREAARFLESKVVPAFAEAGHRIRAILTDRGPEFYGAFAEKVQELGIEHRRIRPKHPWTNGFVERLQGTILTELWRCAFRRTYYRSVRAMQRDLAEYLRIYNFERAHQGYRLRGKAPAQVFFRMHERKNV